MPPPRRPRSEIDEFRRISFFRFLTDDDRSRLARIGVRRSYAAGEPIVEEGSDRGGLFVILTGTAEVEAGDAVHVLGPGDFFGELGQLTAQRRTATVLAAQPVEAMVFEAIDIRAFLIENPSVAVTLLEGVANRLVAAQTPHGGSP
jgi:CRP-like cAMP-binding protein